MQKEILTLNNISKDLKIVANIQMHNTEEWRIPYIIVFTVLALMAGILLRNIFVGLFIFGFAVYYIVLYARELKKYKMRKREIMNIFDREDISISVEQLSHIAEETIYEPHSHGRHMHSTKEVTSFYFMSGGSWRVPRISKHYAWSKDCYITTRGLKNISLAGDEFYYISLKGHYTIAYIYPCKTFALDSELKLKA
jgi:hypothetical protein